MIPSKMDLLMRCHTGVEEAALIVAIVGAAAGAGVGTYGAVSSANAAKETAKANQEADAANAQAASDAAALEANQVRRRNLLRLGEQRAKTAKSGVLIDDSASDVIYDSAIQGELEARSALYSGATQSAYYASRGQMARTEGANAARASYIGAGSTILGATSSANSAYQRYSSGSYARTRTRSEYGPS